MFNDRTSSAGTQECRTTASNIYKFQIGFPMVCHSCSTNRFKASSMSTEPVCTDPLGSFSTLEANHTSPGTRPRLLRIVKWGEYEPLNTSEAQNPHVLSVKYTALSSLKSLTITYPEPEPVSNSLGTVSHRVLCSRHSSVQSVF